jgi:hypothetical protein
VPAESPDLQPDDRLFTLKKELYISVFYRALLVLNFSYPARYTLYAIFTTFTLLICRALLAIPGINLIFT